MSFSTDNHQAYNSSASFVPQLATKVTSLLAPTAGDFILDLGCGDGVLTSKLAEAVGPKGHVLGLDASAAMIDAAKATYAHASSTYRVHDCASLSGDSGVAERQWDKIFSNAALHWVLRDAKAREGLFGDCFAALRTGGKFVFEMGGKGNVDEVHAAVIGALVAHGVPIQQARDSIPWFFPSEVWMKQALQKAGFTVEVCEMEYRPTKLNPDNAQGSGGLEGWVRLMAAQPLTIVEPEKKDSVVSMISNVLESVITREEDGSRWIGYVRLRAVAVKP